jgi:hypothetical protein
MPQQGHRLLHLPDLDLQVLFHAPDDRHFFWREALVAALQFIQSGAGTHQARFHWGRVFFVASEQKPPLRAFGLHRLVDSFGNQAHHVLPFAQDDREVPGLRPARLGDAEAKYHQPD